MTVSLTPRGTLFARFARALAVAKGNFIDAEAYAAGQDWRDTPAVALALKAAADFMTTDNTLDTASRAVALDLAEFLRPLTIVGRLTGMQRVPFQTRVIDSNSGATAAWVSQGAPAPATKLDLSDQGVKLQALKVAAISVLTPELVRNSGPAADSLVAAEIAKAIVAALDSSFIDPAFGGVPDESPPAVTHGATSFESAGTDIASIDADIARMIGALVAAEMPLSTAQWVMSPVTATALSLKRGTGGAPAYPLVNAKGGWLAGLPVVTSTHCAASGSPGERHVALIEASEIQIADDGQASIDVSGQAALQMNDAPGDGGQQLVSLWQNGLTGILGTRTMNWRRRRDGAVAVLRSVYF